MTGFVVCGFPVVCRSFIFFFPQKGKRILGWTSPLLWLTRRLVFDPCFWRRWYPYTPLAIIMDLRFLNISALVWSLYVILTERCMQCVSWSRILNGDSSLHHPSFPSLSFFELWNCSLFQLEFHSVWEHVPAKETPQTYSLYLDCSCDERPYCYPY